MAKNIGLKVENGPSGKVEFKWDVGYSGTHCMVWKYVQTLDGNKTETIKLKSELNLA